MRKTKRNLKNKKLNFDWGKQMFCLKLKLSEGF